MLFYKILSLKHLGTILKEFLHVITQYVWDKKLHTPKRIFQYSKRYGHHHFVPTQKKRKTYTM